MVDFRQLLGSNKLMGEKTMSAITLCGSSGVPYFKAEEFNLKAELEKNAWKGGITSDVARYLLGNNHSFTYLVRNVSKDDCTELQEKDATHKNEFVVSFINGKGEFEESGFRIVNGNESEPYFENGRPNHIGGTVKNLLWTIMNCDPDQLSPLK